MSQSKKSTGGEITDALTNLKGEMPTARVLTSEAEKEDLIKKIGPRTAKSILAMRGKAPVSRIPFLFSSVDTQAVVDLLANAEQIDAALARCLALKDR